MRKLLVITVSIVAVIILQAFNDSGIADKADYRKMYSVPTSQWPKPTIQEGVEWVELGVLPAGPLEPHKDSLQHLIDLGKILFFDNRLSGSGKISCASCHQPEFSWADGKQRSLGHEGAVNNRNSPSLLNVWFYKTLFRDGRSRDLEDQAFAPINSESEMHQDMSELPFKLRKIKGYSALFTAAYGDDEINPDRIAGAIATFEKTIVSRPSRFDAFINGDRNALSLSELRGLHVFRTRGGCMNCHHGPMFTDNKFHKTIIPGSDLGRYNFTHKEEDKMTFKTPSLRDVINTGPWMHDGSINSITDVISFYNKVTVRPGQPNISFKGTDIADIEAFLKSISSPPLPFQKPSIPE